MIKESFDLFLTEVMGNQDNRLNVLLHIKALRLPQKEQTRWCTLVHSVLGKGEAVRRPGI